MSSDSSFSGREAAGILTFVLTGLVIGWGSYHLGLNMAGHKVADEMGATSGAPVVNGAALYATNCQGCHGAKGVGGGQFPALKTAAGWSEADFSKAVLEGVGPGGRALKPVMPHFGVTGLGGEPATPEKVKAIHDYLISVK